MYDIIIVGAGPAGMTAGIYAKRANKNVLILEGATYGGELMETNKIENYPGEVSISGVDLANKFYEQVISLGIKVKFEKVIDIKDGNEYKEVITSKEKYKTKTIILATGRDKRLLGLPKEKELTGRGISYCATCDGNFFKKKDVAIVGAGKTAIVDALYLSDIVNKVYLIYHREAFREDVSELKEKKNIEFVLGSDVTKLIGDEQLKKIEITKNDGTKSELEISCLFVAIGRVPENQNFAKVIKLDKDGYFVTDENCHTNVPGIFACGDAREKVLRQIVTATSDGAISATEAIKYMNQKK